MKSLLIACLLVFSGFAYAPAANAVSVTYTFTGVGVFSGTDFTYISPSGFLAVDTGQLTPTTATNLGESYWPITSFEFTSPTLLELFSDTTLKGLIFEGIETTSPYDIGALTAGEILDSTFSTGETEEVATLAITDTPTAATPEPSSLLFLGTGLVGMAASMRRRFLNS